MEWWEELLKCPVCGGALGKDGGSLRCAARHCFDIAARGYVNLAPASASGGGDDATLIAARTAFLSAGHYAPVAARVCELLNTFAAGGTVLDAGCGEGYYTCEMAKTHRVIGADLSKRGVKAGASRAARAGVPAWFTVASLFDLPIRDGVCDAVVSLFAPVAEAEFSRILKTGGVLILAGAGPAHLAQLKSVLYDTPRENEARADRPVSLTELSTERLRFRMLLSGEEARCLFAMTPYYYRTPREGIARLDMLTELTCDADVTLSVFRKEAET